MSGVSIGAQYPYCMGTPPLPGTLLGTYGCVGTNLQQGLCVLLRVGGRGAEEGDGGVVLQLGVRGDELDHARDHLKGYGRFDGSILQ